MRSPRHWWRRLRGRGGARVALESVGLTAGDGMLIVRYRVLRPGVLDLGPDRFALVDEATGERLLLRSLAEPGRLAVTEARRRGGCYVLVANRDERVRAGSRLTVRLGGGVWEGVVVGP